MKADYKEYVCKIKTAGITAQQIRQKHPEWDPDDAESYAKSLHYLDGVTAYMSLWDYDGGKDYHLDAWYKVDNDKVMMAFYYAEQISTYGTYLDCFDGFKADWDAKTYEPDAVFCLDKEYVEVLGTVRPDGTEVRGEC